MLQRKDKGWRNDTSVRKIIKNNGQFLRSRDRKKLVVIQNDKKKKKISFLGQTVQLVVAPWAVKDYLNTSGFKA